MHKMNVTLSIYVPDTMFCNVDGKELCRFCVKHKNGYTCALFNKMLEHNKHTVFKYTDCLCNKSVDIH